MPGHGHYEFFAVLQGDIQWFIFYRGKHSCYKFLKDAVHSITDFYVDRMMSTR